ncbi:hypothetical protein A2872_04550 [Candidatus Gottesmanbacteria bacterium RIFCSPHIGHO2_01_FULL_42_12]|uniref:AAA+ ATPase domain-containing protein n=1 Tax=Candidatus Gottesmanbacteria bacterium RIFCSPHIGHO2_01_FULL_42_12 TaxID=1798377 RepID=A0A1F5YZN8_9BACT|nr:MAG: hypothetical protein A2872_04550 [Candidatus Gottesmanbacteria bacterium RIFCSPHIGHO2_01_FULL_42_12]
MTQKEALDLLMMGRSVFLTGQAGSGKTYLLTKYIEFLKNHKIGVAVTASTGIAATHLNGITIHSWAGIGIKDSLDQKHLSRLLANENVRNRINNAKVLIIDEISMFHSYRLDMVNQVCKTLRRNNTPFGGLQVILCGDFFQLPPVTDPGQLQSCFAFKSDAWGELDLKICYLDEQHRQLDDSFLKVLNSIRTSDVNEFTFEKLAGRLNKNFPVGIIPSKLYTHNVDVDAINNFELAKITKPEHKFMMTDMGNPDLVETLKKGCLAPEELIVKEGAVVMFVKNNQNKGYVNGTLGKITGFDPDGYPIIKTYSDKEIVATPVSWTIEDDEEVIAEISQVPLRLAWAITIHKSQGMTLDAAEIDLSKSFAYGMGYVALSRVKSLDGIRLMGINQNALLVDEEITKIDGEFRKLSAKIGEGLKNLDSKTVKAKQKEFLTSILPKTPNPHESKDIVKELFEKYFSSH